MTVTIKKPIFAFLTSVLLIFLFNQVTTTILSSVLLAVGIPFLMYIYSNIIFGNNNERVLIYNQIVSNKFTIIKTIILYLSLIVLSETYQDPDLEILIRIQEYVTIIFLFVLFAQCLYSINIKNINFFINTISSNIYTYLLTVWFLGTYAETLYNWSLDNQNESIAVFAAIIISFLAFGNIFKKVNVFSEKKEGALYYAESPKELSEKDKMYTAIHEAGHALFYASVKKIPDNFKIVLNKKSSRVLGYVTFLESETIIEEKNYSEWLMMVYLAGLCAENFRYGDSTLGGGSDYREWSYMAKKYLSNGHCGVFYSNPSNEYEHKENQEKLENLKEKQEKIIEKFFEINEEVLFELADDLMKKGTISKKEIKNYFKDVILNKEIPYL